MRSALALRAWPRYTEAPMTEPAAPQPPQPEPPAKPPSAAGYLWIFGGIVIIAALLTMSLFIAGL